MMMLMRSQSPWDDGTDPGQTGNPPDTTRFPPAVPLQQWAGDSSTSTPSQSVMVNMPTPLPPPPGMAPVVDPAVQRAGALPPPLPPPPGMAPDIDRAIQRAASLPPDTPALPLDPSFSMWTPADSGFGGGAASGSSWRNVPYLNFGGAPLSYGPGQISPYSQTPDQLAQGLQDLTAARRQRADVPANPPFASVRGGPTMANPLSGGRVQNQLADYLVQNGTAPEIADNYRTGNVNFSNDVGYGSYGQWKPRIDLGGYIAGPGADSAQVVQAAQHEAVHTFDANNHITASPMFRQAVALAKQLYPAQSAYLRAVPDPNDYGHMYTAAYDQGLSLGEIPPPLQRFYLRPDGTSLLNTNLALQNALRLRSIQAGWTSPTPGWDAPQAGPPS